MTDFPVENLPLGRIEHRGQTTGAFRIDDDVVPLAALIESGLWEGVQSPAELAETCGEAERARSRVRELLEAGKAPRVPLADCRVLLPIRPGAFVDFYSSEHHATNVGKMLRDPNNPLLPNWKHLPVAYNGRASTVVVSGEEVRRPKGQVLGPGGENPSYVPTRTLDFELELGAFTQGRSTQLLPEQAVEHVLGYVLVNDWSARDVQRWEYQPLGPFLAKSFATSISPWIVLPAALEPFRVPGPPQHPEPLPHLAHAEPRALDIELEILLQTERMHEPQTICRTNVRELYWSVGQQLAHASSNGTELEPGDLYASGTISGPAPGSFGSMLELAWRGERPIRMEETGEERSFLSDGDTVIFRGWCERPGLRIGFGELRSRVLAANERT